MSSKSRKKSQPPKRKTSPKTGDPAVPKTAAAGAAGGSEEHKSVLENIPDELVHVPRDTSRLRFLLMILLVIVLLVIFVVPDAIQALSGGGRADVNEAVARWVDGDGNEREIGGKDFVLLKQNLDRVRNIDPFLFIALGFVEQRPTDLDTARVFILEQIAKDSGIEISDADLADHLRSLIDQRYGGDVNAYRAFAENFGGAAAVETVLRQALRAKRYLDLQGYITNVPDPKKIEELWHTDHLEYAFDYVEVSVEDFEEQARAELPDDETLTAWWEEQPEITRLLLRSPEQRRAELVRFVGIDETPAAALVAAYPRPADLTPEELAEDYYNRVYTSRFRRPDEPVDEPVDEEGGPSEEDEDASDEEEAEQGAEPPPDLPEPQELFEYLSPDEVSEQCAVEAPVFFALEDWLADLSSRQTAGEEIDLAAEAEQYGLKYELTDATSREDLTTLLDERGEKGLANLVFQTLPEAFYPFPYVSDDTLTLVRVKERIEPAVPPIEEIRDEVLEKWVEERRKELAEAKLAALRDSFDELVLDEEEEDEELEAVEEGEAQEEEEEEVVRRMADEATFRTAVEAAGLTVGRRDWLDKRSSNPNADPKKEESAHIFLRGRPDYYELEPDEVAEIASDRLGEYAYLIRLAGTREVPLERMNPRDYNSYKMRSASETGRYVQEALSDEILRERYFLWLAADEFEGEDEDLEDEDEPLE